VIAVPLFRAIGAVAAIAVVYALSPMTVWFALAIVPIVLVGTHGLDAGERRWVLWIVVAAIALRLLAIVVLFLVTDHWQVPFGRFFGDEEYFIKRSLWLRNVAAGIPVHAIDLEYAFEPNGRSSYLYLLAFIQAVVGPAPYGLHLLSIVFYVLATLLLYRTIRATLGRMPALFGLTVLLWLPSLFAWSVSVLKEPLFVLLNACSLTVAIGLARASSFGRRALALAGLVVLAAVLESVRPHGAMFALLAIALGLATAYVAVRPRLMLATLVVTPVLFGAVFSRPAVQLEAYTAVQNAARQHWGAVVVSQGVGYHLLDERFYSELNQASTLEFSETLRFLSRATVSYLTVPRPWDARSWTAAVYLPEQIIWYILVALVPVGALYGFRRDPIVTALLIAHALLIAAGTAFTEGNVGTLVRHRGLVLPYLVWLSGVGACELLGRRRGSDMPPVRPLSGLRST
jgi:hypothetical protein